MPFPRLLLVVVLVAGLLVAGCGNDGGNGNGTGLQAGDGDQPRARLALEGNAGDGGTLAQVPEIFQKLQPSVVAVLVRGSRGEGEGSGVVFRPNYVITNQHVIDQGENIIVALASGERIPAEVVGADRLTDLAVLRVQRELPPAPFADELPQIGSLAVAMGNPLGFENTVTAGIVSGLDRSIPSGGRTPALVGLVQTDAAISPGNSGGALVGERAQVIGINVAFIPPEARAVAIGFAIPAPTAIDVATELIEQGRVDHAFLGVSLRPLTPDIQRSLDVEVQQGAAVAAVEEGGPAAEAGVRPGDVIVAIGDREVRRIEDIYAALRDLDPGQQVQLTVLRGGERQQLQVTLGERPRILAEG